MSTSNSGKIGGASAIVTDSELAKHFEAFFEEGNASIIETYLQIAEALQYEGFDPAYTYKIMLHKGSKASKTPLQVRNDIRFLAMVATIRGTNMKKILSRSSETLTAKMLEMRSIYGIVQRDDPKAPLSKKDITLSRMTSICPDTSCIINTARHPDNVSEDLINDVPWCMRCPAFAALIPKAGPLRKPLEDHHFKWLVLFDKVINPKDHTSDTQIKKYQVAAISNKVNSDDRRIILLKQLLILDDSGDLRSFTSNDLYEPHPSIKRLSSK